MTSFLVSVKGAAHPSGTASSHNGKFGLPKGMKLSDLVGSNRKYKESCSSFGSSSTLPLNLGELEISLGRSKSLEGCKSRRAANFETKCHVATEREPRREEEAVSDSKYLPSEADRKPFCRFSHFLREITRQDVWAGLFDPFQAASNTSSEANYYIQELKMRNETPGSPNMSSSASKMVSILGEQSSPSTPVSFYPESDSVFRGTRINRTSVSSATDLLSYPTEVASVPATGTETYVSVKGNGLSSVTVDSKGLVLPVESAKAKQVLREVSQAEVSQIKCVTAQEIGSVDNLARWLKDRIGGSQVSQWGVAPGTKQVANLWCELVEGEISLQDSSPPKRFTHVISVKIKNEEGHVLVEAYQEMADGRRRPRNRPLSEKVRPGEHVEEACLRGIFEELGCKLGASDRVEMFPDSYQREEEERESFSYPGLPTRYVIHTMAAHIQQLPSTEFSTDEDESGHGGSPAGVAALSGSGLQKKAVGVKRHFWRWVPENRLAELCRR